MHLYFLRHGIAAERDSVTYPDDDQRPLTKEGIKQLRKTLKRVHKQELIPAAVILSSPLLRARETAVWACKILAPGLAPVIVEELAPGCTFPKLADILTPYQHNSDILLVGHEPDFSELVALLVGPGTRLTMKKGSIADVYVSGDLSPGSATLEWLLPPRI
ncbi:MAG: phosphohistidine phosphatase SixA [Chloroflexi bacterium]|nr:phosphohistidine phosphatase SixA [Chloroflexota bacterium]